MMITVICNDRLGKKVRVKCEYLLLSFFSNEALRWMTEETDFCFSSNDKVGDLKMLIAAQTGTDRAKIVLKKWYNEFKDHITLADCILAFLSSSLSFFFSSFL